MSPRILKFSSSVCCCRPLLPVLIPTFSIILGTFSLPIQLPSTKWGRIPLWSYLLSLIDMYLPPFHVPLLLWWFLHLMSLVPYQPLFLTLWLGNKGNQNSPRHMTRWCSILKISPLWSWVVLILWSIPSSFFYLCFNLNYCVTFYTEMNVTLVVSLCICLNVSKFSQYFPHQILPAWLPGGIQDFFINLSCRDVPVWFYVVW